MHMNNEDDLETLEKKFLAVSGVAFDRAYQQAVASGHSVLVSGAGYLYEITPSGEQKKIKEIAPPVVVDRDSRVELK